MREGDGEDAVAALGRLHVLDEAPHRLDGRAPHADHPAVMDRHDWFRIAPVGGEADIEQFGCAFAHVDMRIFLEDHERIRVLDHLRGDRAVEVQLTADYGIRPDDPAHPGEQVALAVLIALRGHGAVHGQEHDIDRHRRAEVLQYLVAKALIDAAHGEARRLGESGEALHDLALALLGGGAPDMQRQAESGGGMPGGIAVEEHGVLEGLQTGRHGREGVGLGPEAGDKDFHGSPKSDLDNGRSGRADSAHTRSWHFTTCRDTAFPGKQWPRLLHLGQASTGC